MLWLWTFFVLAGVCSSVHGGNKRQQTLAVLGITAEPDIHQSDNLVSLLEAGLSGTDDLTLVERREIDLVIKELQLSMGDFLRSDQKMQAGRMLGADLIGYGFLTRQKTRIRVRFRIVEVETGRVVGSFLLAEKDPETMSHKLLSGMIKSIKTGPVKNLPTFTIASFMNDSNYDRFDDFEKILFDKAFDFVAGTGNFVLLERESTGYLLDEIDMFKSGIVAEDHGARPGRALKADYVLKGSFAEDQSTRQNGQWLMNVTVELWDCRHRRRVWSEIFQSPSDRLEQEFTAFLEKNMSRVPRAISFPFNLQQKAESREYLRKGLTNLYVGSRLQQGGMYDALNIEDYLMKSHFSGVKMDVLDRDDPRAYRRARAGINDLENALFLDPDNTVAKLYLGMALCDLYRGDLNHKSIGVHGRRRRILTMLRGAEMIGNVFPADKKTFSTALFEAVSILDFSRPHSNPEITAEYEDALYRLVRLAFDNLEAFSGEAQRLLKDRYEIILTRGSQQELIHFTRKRLADIHKDKAFARRHPETAFYVFQKIAAMWREEYRMDPACEVAGFFEEQYESENPVYAQLAYFWTAKSYQRMKDYTKARDFYRKAQDIFYARFAQEPLETFESSSWGVLEESFFQEAYMHLENKEYQKAIDVLAPFIEGCFERNRYQVFAYDNALKLLGRAYEEEGLIAQAIEYYQKVLDAEYPKNVYVDKAAISSRINKLKFARGDKTENAGFALYKLADVKNAREIVRQGSQIWILKMSALFPAAAYSSSSTHRGTYEVWQDGPGGWVKADAPLLTDSQKISVLFLHGNNLWVGTYGDGLFRQDLVTKRVDSFTTASGLLSDYIVCLASSAQELFIGLSSNKMNSDRGGVLRYHYGKRIFSPFPGLNSRGVRTSMPMALHYDEKRDALWVGYPRWEKAILHRYSLAKKQWDAFMSKAYGKFIFQILPYHDDLLFGMGDELARYNLPEDGWADIRGGRIDGFKKYNIFETQTSLFYEVYENVLLTVAGGKGSQLQIYNLETGEMRTMDILFGRQDTHITAIQTVGQELLIGTDMAVYKLTISE